MKGGGTHPSRIHKAHRGRLRLASRGNHVTKGGTTATISDSTVAIIGTGNIGSRLAANFADGGQDFIPADRDQEAARELAASLGSNAEA